MSEDVQTNRKENVNICDKKKKKKDWEPLFKFSRKSDGFSL